MTWSLDPTNVGTGLPLEGVRVLDLSRVLAGPLCAMIAGDLGADVIKVEAPNGDPVRSLAPPRFGGDATYYLAVNRHRRNVVADLRDPKGFEKVAALVRLADAVVENYLPSQITSLGIDHLREMNPECVWVSITPATVGGPVADQPSFDLLAQARSGIMGVTGEPDGPPARFGLSIVDLMTGTTAALGMLAGIIDARANGTGRDIDVSLYDVAMNNLSYVGTWYLNEGAVVGREPRSAHPSLTPSQMYRTRDGWLFIMCNKEKFWPLLANAIGKPEWAGDPDFCNYKARLANRERLTRELDTVLGTASTEEWLKRLAGIVPVAPVYDIAQALENPFAREQGRIMQADHPVRGEIRTLACPIRCPGEPDLVGIAPALGEHTQALLAGLGYDRARIDELERSKAI
jgi:crotonobetainyl-CoA:carnitine CoA-transferase CaiB-like acyl-CoA transferase